MEDTNWDSQHTNADKSPLMQQQFSSGWARIAYNNLKVHGCNHLVAFDDYGSSEHELFNEPLVPLGLWMNINGIGEKHVIGWAVEIATTSSFATHRLASKILNDAATCLEAVVQLAIHAHKIDSGIDVNVVDDGKYFYMRCHYNALPETMIPIWSPSSALLPYTLAMGALGYLPTDCTVGFSYKRWGEMGYDRAVEYRWLFPNPTCLTFDFKQPHEPLRGYFIRWLKRDLENRNIHFQLREDIDCEPLHMTMVDSVQSVLRQNLTKMSQKQVATKLAMSDRAMRRALQSEGSSYQALHDQHLISLYESPAINSLSLAQAATRLGYGSGQSLKRALDTAMQR